MRYALVLLFGLRLAACTADVPPPDGPAEAPQTPAQQAIDPDDGPVDARIEGVWERADGVVLLLNEFGTLRVEGVPGQQGQRWDFHGDTLTLYLQPGGAGAVAPQDYRVTTLTPDALVLAPDTSLGGSFARQLPVP